jgi:hypothetical protein
MNASDENRMSNKRSGIAGFSRFDKSGLNLTDGCWLMRKVINDAYGGEVSAVELKKALGWSEEIFRKVRKCAVEQRILSIPDGKPRSLRLSSHDEFRGDAFGVMTPIISRIPDEFKIRGTASDHLGLRGRNGSGKR